MLLGPSTCDAELRSAGTSTLCILRRLIGELPNLAARGKALIGMTLWIERRSLRSLTAPA